MNELCVLVFCSSSESGWRSRVRHAENGEEISNNGKAAVVYGACSVKFNLIVN
jgi:hypothetical protein